MILVTTRIWLNFVFYGSWAARTAVHCQHFVNAFFFGLQILQISYLNQISRTFLCPRFLCYFVKPLLYIFLSITRIKVMILYVKHFSQICHKIKSNCQIIIRSNSFIFLNWKIMERINWKENTVYLKRNCIYSKSI